MLSKSLSSLVRRKKGKEADCGKASTNPSSNEQPVKPPPGSATKDRSETYGLFFLNQQQFEDVTTAGKARSSLDIVALHGLNGDAYNTWTHQNGKLWLRDFLAQQLPGSRVFTFGYPSEVAFTLATGQLAEFARSLLEELNNLFLLADSSHKEQSRRIIFVCHSMGGIVAKQAVVIAVIDAEDYANIRDSVIGILFLGTPHRGSSTTQLPQVLANIANAALTGTARFTGRIRTDLLKSLARDSDVLKTISTNFRNQASNIKIVSFIEQNMTPPFKQRVVDDVSGVMDIPKETIVPMDGCDHQNICKFGDPICSGYRKVSSHLEKLANACLKSLSFPQLDVRQHNIKAGLKESCNWLFKEPAYCRWYDRECLENHHGLLWIKGKPGSGKSTLIKEAFRRAKQQLPAAPLIIAAFFFNARGSDLEKSPLGLYRSILHQILQCDPKLVNELLENFQEKKRTRGEQWEWCLEELQNFFKLAYSEPNGYRTIIFVDALDECDEKCIRGLVSDFRSVTDSAYAAGSDLNICLSSRHYPAITTKHCPEITVERGNTVDIARYVQVKLHDLSHVDDIISSLEAQIVKKASGIFLWVVLVVDILIEMIDDGKTVKDMEEVLYNVPEDLAEFFSNIFKTLRPNERPTAVKLFQWVLLTKRPLNLADLCLAIAFTTETPYMSLQEWKTSNEYIRSYGQMVRMMRSYSRGLIEVTGSVAQFIHETVRELFLRGVGFTILDKSLPPRAIGEGHSSISRACLNLISIDELRFTPHSWKQLNQLGEPGWTFENLERNCYWSNAGSRDNSILEYAVDSLFYHSRQAEDNGVVPYHLVDLLSGTNIYLWERWKALRLIKSRNTNMDLVEADDSLLYALCAKDLIFCAIYLLELGADPNEVGISARYPIIAATQGLKDPLKMVLTLLNHNANVNVRGRDGWTALRTAAEEGRDAVVRLLLEYNADINVKTTDGETTLHWAAKNGRKKMMQLLLEQGADVGMTDNNGRTALRTAAEEGHDTVIQLLLEYNADINAKTTDGETTLHWAAKNGRKKMIQLLLKQEADISAMDNDGRTALCIAAEKGHSAVVLLLLEHGAEICAKDNDGRTILHWIAWWGYQEIVQWLLENKADVAARTRDGETALHWASQNGHGAVVRLLLLHKVDIDAKNIDMETALHCAVKRGQEEVVRLLLGKEADVAENKHGWTALHWAALYGYKVTVLLLLEYGADVSGKTESGEAALHYASQNGHEAVVRLLLLHKADINTKNIGGETALHLATKNGHEGTVQLLLEYRADISVKDKNGRTALRTAAEEGHETVLLLLLKYKWHLASL